jgi:hypothetical protein
MRFLVKNLTGDINNADESLREGKKLYCWSDNMSATMILGPQETRSISQRSYNELLVSYPTFIQLVDAGGMDDLWDPFRKTITLVANTWTLVDLGRISSQFEIHNESATDKVSWSFSGIEAPETAPDAKFISDLNPNETLAFWNAMNPLRYVYLFSTGTATVNILVS